MNILFDIETNGLDPDKIWIICAVNVQTGEEFVFTDHDESYPNLSEFRPLFDNAKLLVGHNICGFDFPVMKKLLGWTPMNQTVVDTFLLSQLNDFPRPSLDIYKKASGRGNHAMATYGFALGDHKQEDPSWDAYSEEMRTRCMSDCHLNVKMFNYLSREVQQIKGISPQYGDAIKLENQIAQELALQKENGWLFDDASATRLIPLIENRMEEIAAIVEPQLKPRTIFIDKLPRESSVLKNGKYDLATRNYFGFECPADGEVPKYYQRTKTIDTDLGNNEAVINLLKEQGWKPKEWNRKKTEDGWKNTSPKLTEDSYDSIEGDLGKLVGEWRTLRSRLGLMNGMIKIQRDDGRIGCEAFVIGTNTFRCRHKGIVNIPGPFVLLGDKVRKMFTSAESRSIVAADSDSNQLRAFAHYLDNPEVSEAVAFGDVHQRTAELAEVTRPIAKNLTYALLFGAGDTKLGQTAGQRGKGKILREKLMVAYPGYERMLQNIHNQWESNANEYGRGFVLGLDGRRIFCERFKALNALLQTFEAIVCKAATVEAMRMIREENLDAKLVAFYHDEINTDCADADAERVSEILEYALGDFITEKYSLNLQMGGSSKTGNDWFAVH